MNKAAKRVVWWGTGGDSDPRSRIIRTGLERNGAQIIDCRIDVWQEIQDKSQVGRGFHKLNIACRLLCAYPILLYRYTRLPDHDLVLVTYLGHLDVFILGPWARLRKKPIAWDVYIPLYDMIVKDRRIIGEYTIRARLIRWLERRATEISRLILLDTDANRQYFKRAYSIDNQRLRTLLVGAEDQFFTDLNQQERNPIENPRKRVLFYGKFIPLHGIETIIAAAVLSSNADIEWVIIGEGQESEKISGLIATTNPENITRIPWVRYEDILSYIAGADVCLGIFGTSEKSARVIPNKVFQILAAGKPLVTRDSPAIRELLTDDCAGVRLVPPGDPEALLDAVRELLANDTNAKLYQEVKKRISVDHLGTELSYVLSSIDDMV